MTRVSAAPFRIVVLSAALLVPATVFAQDAAIAGVVSDTSGGVLPGVTVTAASPVLIEQQRTVVADSEGRYLITPLRPGTYTVTFTLPGFATVVREGIVLSAGFTANVEASMRVGAIEETVTVTGATPIVDLQSVRRQTVVTSDLLEALPTSTQSVGNLATLTSGLTGIGDVGGRYEVEPGRGASGGGLFHGKAGTKVSYDGMGMENSSGNSSYQLNSASVEEMVMQTSGISADTNADGVVVNIVPKEGSNRFAVSLTGRFANQSLESTNLSDELKARGLLTANKTIKMFDESATVGGPIKRDRIWFFVAPRTWGLARSQAGTFWNKTQNVFLTPPGADRKVVLWTPWVDRPEDHNSGRREWYDTILTRVTWQATERDKLNFTYDEQRGCNCGSFSSNSSHEYYIGQYEFDPNRLVQATWNSPVTGKLLLEAGYAATVSQWNMYYAPGLPNDVTNDIVSIYDVGLGQGYGSPPYYLGHPDGRDRYTGRASISYVTGSHNFKTGFQVEHLNTNTYYRANGDVNYYLFNGTPITIVQRATPYLSVNLATESGIYAQDQWKLGNRLTLNLGVRWDTFHGYVPDQRAGFAEDTDGYWAGATTINPWLGQRTFDGVDDVPNFKDVNPRVGATYDLFGDGRTAVKVSLGRYVAKSGTDIPESANPINTSINSVTRAWTDINHDYVPDCDLGNFEKNGECEKISNENFGKNNPNATQYDPEALTGYGKRGFNWDFTLEVQHQLSDGLGISGGYYRNTGGYYRNTSSTTKQRVTDNLAVTPADYDPYCIIAPTDSRLPGGGGYEICGLYDINPDKYGQVENLITLTEKFGNVVTVNNFFNASLDARLPRGIRLQGGFDTGRSLRDACFVVDSPQDLLYCHVVTPFKAQTQVKLNGVVPLPLDFVASFAYQNIPGPDFQATYTATNAEISRSLGRSLAGGARTATIDLVAPQTLFADRLSRLDLRLSKAFNVGRVRLQVNLDAYNAFNADSVRSLNSRYGSRWQEPTQILDPRLLQIGGQIRF